MNIIISVLILFIFQDVQHPVQDRIAEGEVRSAIETFFEGMRESSGDKINSVIYSDMTLQTVVDREGNWKIFSIVDTRRKVGCT